MTLKDLNNIILKNFSNVSIKIFNIKKINLKKSTIFLFLFIFSFIIYNFYEGEMKSYKKTREDSLNNMINSSEFIGFKDYLFNKFKSPYSEYKYIIKNNDSIEKILNKFNVNKNEIKEITTKLKKNNLSNIYAGRKFSIVIKEIVDQKNSIVSILYPISNTLSVEVRKNDNNFIVRKNIIILHKKEVVVKNVIKNNLYSAAMEAGVEPNVIVEFARIFGFEVDFQRDIRKDDWFEIYYEKFIDDNGKVKDTGKILYASMYVNNREINLYNFKHENENGFYDIKGKSIVKALMKTPINGARLSSSYGMRKHPILGFNKKHNGTDFAAPSGTPIMASGSGTVTRARWCGGGGNCVKIRHNSTYETIYAHMKNFAKGIKEGRKVSQGQIIGYVGSTGMSTGPHLHYEVVLNGKKVNSQKLKLPSGKVLDKNARKEFEIDRIKIDLKLSELRDY
jgi:murein DD-endopeptidase MepM/ murein hydrolase activator NlpD|tara:strand:+ start:166 stop:1515 length:1350 start_codon:yes stop_codon:yes gene_type:complete